MVNNMFICSWIEDDQSEVFRGCVSAHHYALDKILDQVSFFDYRDNFICIIADVNTVRKKHKKGE